MKRFFYIYVNKRNTRILLLCRNKNDILSQPHSIYIHKDYIYLLGGEGGSGCAFGQVYGQHLTMFLRARITISPEHET